MLKQQGRLSVQIYIYCRQVKVNLLFHLSVVTYQFYVAYGSSGILC